MYDSILLPTDGSEVSEQAAEEAFELASEFDATVHIIYVVNPIEHGGIEGVAAAEDHHMHDLGEKSTHRLVEKAEQHGVKTISEVVTGSPHSAIINYAEENAIDLIVMGTHGRTGAKRVLLGSTTERVIRNTDQPVLTTH